MRNLRFMVLIYTVMIIAGCGSESIINGNPISENTENEKKEVVFWHTFSEKETVVFENFILPLFHQEYPLIEVRPVRQPYNQELISAIISRASANNPPDVVRMDMAWVPHFADLGLLFPVSEFVDFKEVESLLFTDSLETNYHNGKYYGVPLNTNTKVSIYNRELLKKAGYDKPPETIEELVSIVQENQYVIGLNDFSIWETLQYFYAFGGMLMNSTYTESQGYLNSDNSISAVEQLLVLYENENISQRIMEGNANKWEGVLDSTYFMIDEGPWFYSVNSLEQIKFINELTVAAPFPRTNGQRAILGGENLVISKGSKYPEEAWTFIKWMTGTVQQTYLAQTGLIPSNKNVDLSEFFSKYPYYETYVEALDDAIVRPPVAEWRKIEEVYIHYLKLIFSGRISVEEGLTKAAIEIDQLLEKREGR